MSRGRNRSRGPLILVVFCILCLGGGAVAISGMFAVTATGISRSRSKAQIAQSQAIQAQQVARQAEQNARQEAERRKQTEVMMEPSIVVAKTLADLAIRGSERDDRILDAYLKLTMEEYETRKHRQLITEIIVFGAPIGAAIGTAFYFFNREQR